MGTAEVTPSVPDPPGGQKAARGLSFGRLGQYSGFLPAVVLFGVFFAAPLGLIVAYSFWQVVDYNVVHDWTLDNYRYFFSVSTYAKTFWATIWVSVAATALTIVIALMCSLGLLDAARSRSSLGAATRVGIAMLFACLQAGALVISMQPFAIFS